MDANGIRRMHRLSLRTGTRLAAALVILAGAVWAAGCNSDRALGPVLPVLPSLIVSDPVTSVAPTVPARGGVREASGISLAIAAEDVVYVSLPPGTIPAGEAAIIRNRRTGSTATAVMIDGGFDPVPVEAKAGDVLELELRRADGADPLHFAATVSARRPPRVVRTSPPRGKRDVALNARVHIVFSEPVDPRTVTLQSIRLSRGTQVVSAGLSLSSDGLRAELQPDAALAPDAEYTLAITVDVADLGGDRLEEPLEVSFTTGAALTGSVRVTTATTGADPDPDGYLVAADGLPGGSPVPSNGGVTIDGLVGGDHSVELRGVADNCTVGGPHPRPVVVPSGDTAELAFAISCFARVGSVQVGSVQVMTVTTGSDIDPDGYALGGDFMADLMDPPIGPNATVTFPDVHSGQRYVWLLGVAENCTVKGEQQRSVNVAPGTTTTVLFEIDCVATAMRFTATTSGVDLDTDGYTAQVQRTGFDRHVSVPVNGSATTAGLLYGDFIVTLSGVAANCDISGVNPQLITLPSGVTTEMNFSIVCAPATLIAYSGSRLYVNPDESKNREIYVVKSNGTGTRRLTTHPAADAEPDWSPGGGKIAFRSDRDGNGEIYVMNADGSAQTRLTTHPAPDYEPAWSPDGSKIAFVSERDGNAEIYVMNADGSNAVRLTTNDGQDVSPAWSPDGGKIAFRSERLAFGAGNGEIVTINADGSNLVRLTDDGADDAGPAWSPDGTKIAFSRFIACEQQFGEEVLCQSDIFVMNAVGSVVTRVAGVKRFFIRGYYADDEKNPAWSPDGRKIAIGATTCVSDGHCHVSSGITVVTLGAPGYVDVTIDHASPVTPAWAR